MKQAFTVENCEYGKRPEQLTTIINIKKEDEFKSNVFKNFTKLGFDEISSISTPYVLYVPQPYERFLMEISYSKTIDFSHCKPQKIIKQLKQIYIE